MKYFSFEFFYQLSIRKYLEIRRTSQSFDISSVFYFFEIHTKIPKYVHPIIIDDQMYPLLYKNRCSFSPKERI